MIMIIWKVKSRRKLYEIRVEFIKEMNCKEGTVWIEITFKNIEAEFTDKQACVKNILDGLRDSKMPYNAKDGKNYE